MNPEELELYKELQPYFPKDWLNGDMFYCPRQAQKGGDGIGFVDYHDFAPDETLSPCCPDIALHLPLPIDPVNPERGLWGMIDWGRWWAHCSKGIIEIDDPTHHFEGTPTFALLRALKVQMEEGK